LLVRARVVHAADLVGRGAEQRPHLLARDLRGARGDLRLARAAPRVSGSGRLRAHRSHSPPIMLMKSKVGIRSASIAPCSIFGIGWRLIRLGGRQRTFHGWAVPSEIT